MSALIELRRVEKRFGDATAVAALDLAIAEGEFLAIMGPSGCGKTTTLRMLAGLERPSAGEIRMQGRVMNDVAPHERDTPMVWQSLALFPFLTVRENVEFGLRMRGVRPPERRARALDWLDRLGIRDFAERDVATLSGGQRQRVALARALVTEPRVLLLDEPLSALDAHLTVRMQGVLTRLQRDLGITFVYVTHAQSEAFAMADRVVVMNEGRIAQVASPRDLYRAPASRFVAEFVGSANVVSGIVEAGGVRAPVGRFALPAAATPPEGTTMAFAIATDRIAFSREPDPAAENALAVTLISETFSGATVTLFFEDADETVWTVQVPERTLAALDLGSGGRFHLSWATADVHVLGESG